jgi:hypothetical protein
MEAARTCETLVNVYQTTRRYNPEDSHLYTTTFLDNLKLNTLHEIRRYFDVLFIRNAYDGFANCPSLLETVGITVANKNLETLVLSFHTQFSRSKYPFLLCVQLSVRCLIGLVLTCLTIIFWTQIFCFIDQSVITTFASFSIRPIMFRVLECFVMFPSLMYCFCSLYLIILCSCRVSTLK